MPFGIIGFYRYFWYLIRLSAAFVYRPVPPPLNPTYIASEDVTIIVPTIDAGEEFKEAAFSWLQSNPAEILIVTETKMIGPLQELANEVDPAKIRVIPVPKANKRLQMVEGIKHTTTDIIVFADDDSIWPPTMLQWMLACFEDQQVGGVGTSQRVKSTGAKMTVWETLAAFRLSIRNFEIASSTHIDGGVPCLSGRTAAYRTVILKDPAFIHGFTNDYWMGKYLLNSGDDKYLTRWMVSHGWNTYIQVCPEVELLSTMKPDWRFLKQVLRWTRNTWRSDIRSVFIERHVWTRHPYTCYTMLDKFINPFTLLSGPALVLYLLSKTAKHEYHLPWWDVIVSYIVWITATRTLKLLPHLWFRPLDIIYVPAYIAFGYYFSIMKLYALCTLHVTAWGTRVGVGEPDQALSAGQEKQPEASGTGMMDPATSPVNRRDTNLAPMPSPHERETYFASGGEGTFPIPRGHAQPGDVQNPFDNSAAPHGSLTSRQSSHYSHPGEEGGYATPVEEEELIAARSYPGMDTHRYAAPYAEPHSEPYSDYANQQYYTPNHGAEAYPSYPETSATPGHQETQRPGLPLRYGHYQASSQSAMAETWPVSHGASDSMGMHNRQTPSTGAHSDRSSQSYPHGQVRSERPIELTTF